MNGKINMDKIFREKLEGFQMEPPPRIWDGILEELLLQHRNRRLGFYKWAAVAAMLAIAFAGGWYYNKTIEKGASLLAEKESVLQERVPDVAAGADINDKKMMSTGETAKEPVIDRSTIRSAGLAESSGPIEKAGGGSQTRLQSLPENYSPPRINRLEAKSVLTDEDEVLPAERNSVNSGFSEAEKRLIAENIRYKSDNDKKGGSWKMGMNVSPGYSSYSASHDRGYANNMTYSATDGNGNISAGVAVRYKTEGKWSVESGVYYVQNGQKSESLPQLFTSYALAGDNGSPFREGLYFNTDIDIEENRMVMNSVAGIIEFESIPQGAEIEASPERTGSYSNALITSGEFSQVFDFVEIPLFLRYLILDSRVDLELAGGINAGLVVGNNAFINNDHGFQKIGKTRDISTVNFSASIGLGVTYDLGKHLSIALEPRMNYYMNSINKNPDVNFRPYRIGLYSGLYYEF